MPLRRRLALVSALAVGIAILLAAVVCYVVVRRELRGQVDDALRAQAVLVLHEGNFALGGGEPFPGLSPSAGGRAPYQQIVGADGSILDSRGGLALPVD